MKSLLQGQEYLYNRLKITYNQTNKTKRRHMNQPMNSFRHNKINFFGFECRWLRVIHTGLLFSSTRFSSYNFNADRTTFFTFTAHLRKPWSRYPCFELSSDVCLSLVLIFRRLHGCFCLPASFLVYLRALHLLKATIEFFCNTQSW